MKLKSFLSIVIVLMILPGLFLSADEKHKVGVSVGIVPVYITDSGGFPVNNINPDELKLKINGKTVPFQFINYSIDLFKKKSIQKRKVVPVALSKKIHVVIIDTLFNSRNGIYKSKEMIKKFIRDDAGKHRFLILQLSLLRGLENLTEITRDSKTLIAAIDKVVARPTVLKDTKFTNRLLPRTAEVTLWDARDINGPFNLDRTLDRAFYKTATYQYESMFERVKYLLTMIKAPKICFLFSEGISRGALLNSDSNPYAGLKPRSVLDLTYTETASTSGVYSSRHLNLLQKIAHSINSAGSIMFGINPLGDIMEEPMDSGHMTLASIVGMSGGKYFEGSDPSVVFKTIKHTTSAYYELAYSGNTRKNKINSVKVTCTRPGVKVNTIAATRGIVTYKQLDETEKKLFVLDIIKGNQNAGIEIIGKRLETDKKSLKITIPEKLVNRKVEIYRVSFNKEGNKISIQTENKKAGRDVKFKVDPRDAERFLVIIDPEQNVCSVTKIVF